MEVNYFIYLIDSMHSLRLKYVIYLIHWIILENKSLLDAASPFVGIKGQYVELQCPAKSTNNVIAWSKGGYVISDGSTIRPGVTPEEFRERLNITGNHSLGEYHLTITNLKKTDDGTYACKLLSIQYPPVQLTVMEGPVSVSIARKTDDNKLLGTEDESLNISCTAVSEDPSPDMMLQINNQTFTMNGTTTIHHTIQKTDRAYDGVLVKCLAGYDKYSDFTVDDSASIYLNLKPLPPTFYPDPVVTKETSPLSVTCTSTGSRPEPSDITWLIYDTGFCSYAWMDNVTPFSHTSSVYEPVSGTYTVTSTLIYNTTRSYNGKTIKCGMKNNATRHDISVNRIIQVLYIPDTPTNLCVVDSTEHTLSVQWIPGDNGGTNQTFVIEYKGSNEKEFKEAVIPDTCYTLRRASNNHTLTQLESRTKHDIRIFAKNSVGSSQKSEIIKMSTMGPSCSSLIGVAVGLSLVTVISLIANGILIYRLLTGKYAGKKIPRIGNPFVTPLNETSRAEVYYHTADYKDESNNPKKDSDYEAIGTTDQPHLYDTMDQKQEGQVDGIYSNSNI